MPNSVETEMFHTSPTTNPAHEVKAVLERLHFIDIHKLLGYFCYVLLLLDLLDFFMKILCIINMVTAGGIYVNCIYKCCDA